MATEKRSFVLYHDCREPLELLTDEERGRLFLAILDYSEKRIIPQFSGSLAMAFAFLRASLDRDAEAWEIKREKRRAAGSIGGKQRQANIANAKNAIQSDSRQANQAVSVPVSVPVPAPVPVKDESIGADKPPRASRFVPPSVSEVAEYCRERGNGVDPQRFVDFYAAKGWMMGKNKMKDWRASVRTWERKEEKDNGPASVSSGADPGAARFGYIPGADLDG